MKSLTIASAVALLVTAGCSGSTEVSGPGSVATGDEATATDGTGAETGTLTPPVTDTEGTSIRSLADGFFVSADELETGENASGGVATGHWTVEFGVDTVEWSYSDVVETGTYTSDDTTRTGTASISGREIDFELDDGDLTWDSRSYLRAATTLVDSRESLTSYLDGSTYDSVEEFDIGETATGELASGSWSLQFDGEEVTWNVQDTAMIGSFTYTGKAGFQVGFGDADFSGYLLDDQELMLDAVVYRKVFASQFDSQESLVSLLDGKTYRSLDQQPVGETVTGAEAFGYWYVSFVEDTFTWDHQDVSEAGTYRYLDDDTFTAVLPGRDIDVAVEGVDIVFDGVRYRGNL